MPLRFVTLAALTLIIASVGVACLGCFSSPQCEAQEVFNSSTRQEKTSKAGISTVKTYLQDTSKATSLVGRGYDFDGNGKLPLDFEFESTFEATSLHPSIDVLPSSMTTGDDVEAILAGIKKQKSYLSKKGLQRTKLTDGLKISNQDLYDTAEILEDWLQNGEGQLSEKLTPFMLKGEDEMGNVQMTSYFIPVLQASRQKTEIFKYPLYRKPEYWPGGKRLTRVQIDDENKFEGLGLEIAYTSSLIDNYFMQVQGSGYLEYADGSMELLSYAGKNGFAYTGIGRILVEKGILSKEEVSLSKVKEYLMDNPEQMSLLNQNESYVFFETSQKEPIGAANVSLTAMHSIAVDPTIIPLGSILLAYVPMLDDYGNFTHHEYRLFLAQDTGGAIKGPGHIDIYAGKGEEALHYANFYHHYGWMWLLMPKN